MPDNPIVAESTTLFIMVANMAKFKESANTKEIEKVNPKAAIFNIPVKENINLELLGIQWVLMSGSEATTCWADGKITVMGVGSYAKHWIK